ncbi:MAG TPA: tetratricopeptide repeat protein [Flavobacteriaceae bacterium]|nr:tetratricopeptide repeat protein [Flavobacteriaceae bacterium]
MAKNYLEEGEYEKALSLYQELYAANPRDMASFYGLVTANQELGQYDSAIELLTDKIKESPNYPNLLVELGYNFQLSGNLKTAENYYSQAIAKISENPSFAYTVGGAFQKYNLLEEAAETYEIANQLRPNTNFSIQLARIYGEQGELEKMFVNYLRLIEENPNLFYSVNRVFGQYISENPDNHANGIFRKLLLKKLQGNPNVLYNQLLSWLFIQQKEYKKAFLQEKAIYMRGEGDLNGIFDLALIAKEKGETEVATEILNYLIENHIGIDGKLKAYGILMNMKVENSSPEDYQTIQKEFSDLFAKFGKSPTTFYLQLEEANFMAFHQRKKQEAEMLLKNLLETNLGMFERAKTKLKLADILVLDEKFNEALIYYSQVQNLVKNDVLAQEARFKVARTSYYKGDFDWAQTQLKVLKTSTSQLIANDAMELDLLISENTFEDSTQTALKLFARADLYAYQDENNKALALLDEILTEHVNEKIGDEALFRKGKILEEKGNFNSAIQTYNEIITTYKDGILADNAYFALAELYENQLQQPQKAKEYYEQILFNYEDSIYFVEARRRFRELRGDNI